MLARTLLAGLVPLLLAPAALGGGLRGEVQMDASISPSGQYASSNTEVASSGAGVYCVWTESAVAPSTSLDIYYSRSSDGGRSWSPPRNLSKNLTVDDDKAQVAAEGNLVVVTWLFGSVLGPQDVRARVSTDAGLTFGPVLELSGPLKGDAGDADSLRLEIEGSSIYLSFEDDAANPGLAEDLYVVSSQDGGATFSNPVRVNDTAPGTADCDDPELDATPSLACMVWVDRRTGNDRVYLSRSTDGGLTWSANQRLDRAGALADASNPSMSILGAVVHVAWTDDRQSPAVADQVYYVRSTDGGLTFSGDRQIGATPAGTDADTPRLSTSGAWVYLAWVDQRNGLGNDVFLARSPDRGRTFGAEFAIDPDQGALNDATPKMRAEGDSVFVMYKEDTLTPGLDQMWVAVSTSNGAAGTFQRQLLTSGLGAGGDADDAQMTVSDQRDLVTVWVDDRAGGGDPTNDVYLNGQRFPNLSVVPVNGDLSFVLDDADASDDGKLCLFLFSLTGTDSVVLPGGLIVPLTVDSFTFFLLGNWALPFVTDVVSGGSASSFPLPLKVSGWCVAVIYDPVNGTFDASSDPVRFN